MAGREEPGTTVNGAAPEATAGTGVWEQWAVPGAKVPTEAASSSRSRSMRRWVLIQWTCPPGLAVRAARREWAAIQATQGLPAQLQVTSSPAAIATDQGRHQWGAIPVLHPWPQDTTGTVPLEPQALLSFLLLVPEHRLRPRDSSWSSWALTADCEQGEAGDGDTAQQGPPADRPQAQQHDPREKAQSRPSCPACGTGSLSRFTVDALIAF